MISTSEGTKEQLVSDLDLQQKTYQKLISSGRYYAGKSPNLSGFYMCAAQDLTKVQANSRSNQIIGDTNVSNNTCPSCGIIFNADNCRVRHYAKKAPSSGRWANCLAREPSPHWSSNTRKRVEKLREARTRTVVTCLKCGQTNTTLGAARLPREQRAKHSTSQPEVTPKRRKKRKRVKETNAGLTICTLIPIDEDSVSNLPLSMPSSPRSNVEEHNQPKVTKQRKVIGNQLKIDAKPTLTNNQNIWLTTPRKATNPPSKRAKDRKHSEPPGRLNSVPVSSRKSGKKKQKAKVNHLSMLLAKEQKINGRTNLADFLKQV